MLMTSQGATQIVAGEVRAELARRGLGQADLIDATGLSRTTVHQRYHGRTAWTAVEITQIANRLGLPVIVFLEPIGAKRAEPSLCGAA